MGVTTICEKLIMSPNYIPVFPNLHLPEIFYGYLLVNQSLTHSLTQVGVLSVSLVTEKSC